MSSILFKNFIRKTILDKQPASGPPRPGLQWNSTTHRWIRPKDGQQKPIKMFGNTFTPNKAVVQTKDYNGKWKTFAPIKTQEDAMRAEKLVKEGVGALNTEHGGWTGEDGASNRVAYGDYRVAHKGKGDYYPYGEQVIAHPGNKPPRKHKGFGYYE